MSWLGNKENDCPAIRIVRLAIIMMVIFQSGCGDEPSEEKAVNNIQASPNTVTTNVPAMAPGYGYQQAPAAGYPPQQPYGGQAAQQPYPSREYGQAAPQYGQTPQPYAQPQQYRQQAPRYSQQQQPLLPQYSQPAQPMDDPGNPWAIPPQRYGQNAPAPDRWQGHYTVRPYQPPVQERPRFRPLNENEQGQQDDHGIPFKPPYDQPAGSSHSTGSAYPPTPYGITPGWGAVPYSGYGGWPGYSGGTWPMSGFIPGMGWPLP